MNIDVSSVVKAGGAAAVVGLILGVLSGIPLLSCLVVPLLCLGSFLLPTGAGLGYGYLAPGKEDVGQSALGGSLAGGFGGLVYGLASGIMGLITNAGAAVMLEDADLVAGATAGIVGLSITLCIAVVAGFIFGAIGGLLWPLVQGSRA